MNTERVNKTANALSARETHEQSAAILIASIHAESRIEAAKIIGNQINEHRVAMCGIRVALADLSRNV